MYRSMVTAAVIALLAAVCLLVSCPVTPRAEPPAALPVEPGSAEEPWIGRPLQDYLATIDHPSSYELRSDSGKSTEAQRQTLFTLVGGHVTMVKVIEGGRWMLIDIEAGAAYAFKDGAEAIIKIPAADLTGFSDPTGAAGTDGTIQRSETIDGHDCWVVRPSGIETRDDFWVDREAGLVRQVQRLGGIHRFSYSRIDEVPQSEFVLPEGVKVIERDVFGGR